MDRGHMPRVPQIGHSGCGLLKCIGKSQLKLKFHLHKIDFKSSVKRGNKELLAPSSFQIYYSANC